MFPMEAMVDPAPPGSRLDADHPGNGVLIPRRNTPVTGPDLGTLQEEATMRGFSLVNGHICVWPRLVGVHLFPTVATIARHASRILAVGTRRLAASGRARRSHNELRNGPTWRLRDIGYEPILIEFSLMVWWSKSASRDKGPVGRFSRENSSLSHQTIDRNWRETGHFRGTHAKYISRYQSSGGGCMNRTSNQIMMLAR